MVPLRVYTVLCLLVFAALGIVKAPLAQENSEAPDMEGPLEGPL
jgi:hypothetical protein